LKTAVPSGTGGSNPSSSVCYPLRQEAPYRGLNCPLKLTYRSLLRFCRYHQFAHLLCRFRARHLQLPYGDQAIFVRRSVFEKLGGFAAVPLAEDLLFMRALKRVGRIRICRSTAITSGRRYWQNGLWRTTIIYQIIFMGCLLGISPSHFLPLYRKNKL
jgi:hypothetical protein